MIEGGGNALEALPQRPVKVLVVDDDPSNLEILGIVLETDGYEVDVCKVTDGPSAVAKALEWHPDLVFMDAIMPGEYDGLEATRRLKANRDFHGVIILQSARASQVDQAQGLDAGADAYLTKPYKRKDVIKLLDGIADRLPQAQLKPGKSREHPEEKLS
jgi:CheY-like chemotaxis protein